MKILIADDHFAVRAGLKAVLRESSGPVYEVVAECASLSATREAMAARSVDAVLLDISFADGSGLDLLADLAPLHPHTAFLVLSMHHEGTFVLRALQAGAHGYLHKESAGEVLLRALDAVVSGQRFLDPPSLNALAETLRKVPLRAWESDGVLDSLSTREREVFYRVARGENSKVIAQDLGVSAKTVDNHKAAIYGKLGVDGTVGLVRFAQQHSLA